MPYILRGIRQLKLKYRDRVEEIWFEDEDGYWALLKSGWTTTNQEAAVHAYTLTDLDNDLKDVVKVVKG